jgi:uncharacterized protein YdbL (DUF1318 family)
MFFLRGSLETKEAIDKFKTDLAEVKSQGQSTVTIEALENYLVGLEKDASLSVEMRKLEYQRTLAHYDAQAKSNLEMFKSVIDAGKEALNATLLINGGAVVAFLGFLGSMLSKGGSEALGLKLTIPLLSFGFGVLSGALGFGFRYCAQFSYARQWVKTGHIINAISVLCATFAYAAFGYGVYVAYSAFTSHFTR